MRFKNENALQCILTITRLIQNDDNSNHISIWVDYLICFFLFPKNKFSFGFVLVFVFARWKLKSSKSVTYFLLYFFLLFSTMFISSLRFFFFLSFFLFFFCICYDFQRKKLVSDDVRRFNISTYDVFLFYISLSLFYPIVDIRICFLA